jgi:hypothetical protein
MSVAINAEVLMPAYSVVILICSIHIGHADCQSETAIDVVRGPRVENAMMCAMAGQAMIARTALMQGDGEEYMKLLCIPADHEIRSASRMTNSQDNQAR